MVGVIRLFLTFLSRRDKIWLVGLSFMSVLSAFLEVFAIGLFVPVIASLTGGDEIAKYPRIQEAIDWFGYASLNEFITPLCWVLLVIFLVKNVYYVVLEWTLFRYGEYIGRKIGITLFRSYLNCSYVFKINRDTSALLQSVTTESNNVSQLVVQPLLMVASNLVLASCMFLFMLYLDYLLFSTLFALIIITFVVFNKLTKNSLRLGGERILKNESIKNQSIIQAFHGFRETKFFQSEQYILNRYHASAYNSSKSRAYNQTIAKSGKQVLEFILVGVVLSLLIFFYNQKEAEKMLVSLSVLGLSMFKILPSVSSIFNSISSIQHGKVSLKHIHSEIQEAIKQYQPRSSVTIPFERELSLHNVSYVYPSIPPKEALHDVSLSIEKNTTVGIVGISGSGKTTLVDVLSGLLHPSGGKVMIDGKVLGTHTSSWWSHIGYVPQQIYIVNGSIRDNIAFGMPTGDVDEERLQRAIVTSNLKELVDEFQDKENTIVGEHGIKLSGGQRQRIGIARALYHNPPVLIMDEATASLDNISEKEVMTSIRSLSGKKTIIIIAHRLSTIRYCDTIFIMGKAKLVGHGSFDFLSKNNEIFKKMLRSTSS